MYTPCYIRYFFFTDWRPLLYSLFFFNYWTPLALSDFFFILVGAIWRPSLFRPLCLTVERPLFYTPFFFLQTIERAPFSIFHFKCFNPRAPFALSAFLDVLALYAIFIYLTFLKTPAFYRCTICTSAQLTEEPVSDKDTARRYKYILIIIEFDFISLLD